MKNFFLIWFSGLLAIIMTGCSTQNDVSSFNRNPSSTIAQSEIENNWGMNVMIDETLREAEQLNESSWFGGMSFLQIVNEDEISPEWSVQMPEGLDGHCFAFPQNGDIRLRDITILQNMNPGDPDMPYSLYGITVGTSYNEALEILTNAGYEFITEPPAGYQNSRLLTRERRFIKYNIWITLYLTDSEDSAATVERMNCLASDPSSIQDAE